MYIARRGQIRDAKTRIFLGIRVRTHWTQDQVKRKETFSKIVGVFGMNSDALPGKQGFQGPFRRIWRVCY